MYVATLVTLTSLLGKTGLEQSAEQLSGTQGNQETEQIDTRTVGKLASVHAGKLGNRTIRNHKRKEIE